MRSLFAAFFIFLQLPLLVTISKVTAERSKMLQRFNDKTRIKHLYL